MGRVRPSQSSFLFRLLLSAASGGLYSLAYPPLGWGWLVFRALAGFLVVFKDQCGSRARAIGFLYGLTAFGVGFACRCYRLWIRLLLPARRGTGRPQAGMA